MFEEVIKDVLYYIIWIIELIGIGIIVYGVFYSLGKFFVDKYKNKKSSIKIVLANYLALGLEFMLAAEILKTVTINREWSEIIVLGSIVILRAAISLLLYIELSYEEKKEVMIEKRKNRKEVKPL